VAAVVSRLGNPMNKTIRAKLESPLRPLDDDMVRAARRAAPDGLHAVQPATGKAAAGLSDRVGVNFARLARAVEINGGVAS